MFSGELAPISRGLYDILPIPMSPRIQLKNKILCGSEVGSRTDGLLSGGNLSVLTEATVETTEMKVMCTCWAIKDQYDKSVAVLGDTS